MVDGLIGGQKPYDKDARCMHTTRYENRCCAISYCHSSPDFSNLSEALWHDLRDLELKLTWGAELNWPYLVRTLKKKLASCMLKIKVTRNVPSDLFGWGCMFGFVLLFLIWHAWPQSKKIALPCWNWWPLCVSRSLCFVLRPAGVHVEQATPWIFVPESRPRWPCSAQGVCTWPNLNYFFIIFRLPSGQGSISLQSSLGFTLSGHPWRIAEADLLAEAGADCAGRDVFPHIIARVLLCSSPQYCHAQNLQLCHMQFFHAQLYHTQLCHAHTHTQLFRTQHFQARA